MNATTTLNPEAMLLLREGWRLLIEQLGLTKATQFVMLIERGQGDSVREMTEYWGDMTIEDIHHRVIQWKTTSPHQIHSSHADA